MQKIFTLISLLSLIGSLSVLQAQDCTNDVTPPTALGCTANFSINSSLPCPFPMPNFTPSGNFLLVVSDNCTPTDELAVTQSPAPGSPLDFGPLELTLTVTDKAGNSKICTYNIQVNDVKTPIISCPPSIDINLNNDCEWLMPNMASLVQVSDNCPSSGEITVVQNIPAGTSLGSESMVEVYVSQHGSRSPSCFVDLNLAGSPPTAVCQPVTIDLDENGKATLTAANADGGSSSSCGSMDLSVSQEEFDCSEVGNHVETLTVSDGNGGQASCDFTVTVRDALPPSYSNCPGNINVFNDQGDCGALVSWTPPILNDNCVGAIGNSTHNSGDFFPVGSTTVTYSGADASNNAASNCSFTVNVTDMEDPRINCPAGISTNTDPGLCEANISFSPPVASDNCSIDEVQARYREVDESNSPVGSWTSRVLDPSGFFPVGRYQVEWRAKDIYGNKSSACSQYIEVSDGEDPIAVCKDVTVEFNGETAINLTVSQVWNESASTDNCGGLIHVGAEPSLTIECEDLGTTVPFTVTIQDAGGNEDECTAYVDVLGLPCGWSEGPQDGSLNCGNDTQVDYDSGNESFTLSADGCWHDCTDADKAVQAYYVLCGDGQIEARLADINFGGYAGLMARESLDPLARRAGALKNYSTRRVRREWRASYGGIVSQSQVSRSRVEWFRLVRTDKKISSYTSTNGSYWRLLQVVTLPELEECLYMSLMAYSLNGNTEVEAVFDNVSVSASGNIASGLIVEDAQLPDQQQSYTGLDQFGSIAIFPNPANDQTQIALDGFEDKPALMIVRDQFGKVVRQLQLDSAADSQQRLNTNELTPGLYLLSIVQHEKIVGTKRLIVQR